MNVKQPLPKLQVEISDSQSPSRIQIDRILNDSITLRKTPSPQQLPLDIDESDEREKMLENTLNRIKDGNMNAFEMTKVDIDSPLTELRRAFDMLQTSAFFVEHEQIEDEELPPTNDFTQLGPCLKTLKSSEVTSDEILPVIQRASRLQTRRPASLCIQDSAKEQFILIRTPSVPPTTLTFPSSSGSLTGFEDHSAFLPFFMDRKDVLMQEPVSDRLQVYSTDSTGKEQDVQWSSPHVHFSDWSNSRDPQSSLSSEDEIQSSPAFENPFCFEDSYAASSCYDSISHRSSTIHLTNSTQSGLTSLNSLQEGDDILTAPPILGREWHRGRGNKVPFSNNVPDHDQSYLDVKSKKPSLSRLTPHINATNKRATMNRGGMRSASATATSTFKNAIKTIKRTTSFYDHGKSAKRKDSKGSSSEDFAIEESDNHRDQYSESVQSAKIYGLALTASHKTGKREGSRKHPNKSPYPPATSRMPSPTPSSPSVSFHFQSPMMASYFATLG